MRSALRGVLDNRSLPARRSCPDREEFVRPVRSFELVPRTEAPDIASRHQCAQNRMQTPTYPASTVVLCKSKFVCEIFNDFCISIKVRSRQNEHGRLRSWLASTTRWKSPGRDASRPMSAPCSLTQCVLRLPLLCERPRKRKS